MIPNHARPLVGQRGGASYEGIEQPGAALARLNYDPQQGLAPPGAPIERTGIDVQARGLAHANAYKQAEFQKDPYSQSGPLPSPMWEGLQQALADQGVTKLRGGAGASGSSQLTGQTAQHHYSTDDPQIAINGRTALNTGYHARLFDQNQMIGGMSNAGAGAGYDEEQQHLRMLNGLRGAR